MKCFPYLIRGMALPSKAFFFLIVFVYNDGWKPFYSAFFNNWREWLILYFGKKNAPKYLLFGNSFDGRSLCFTSRTPRGVIKNQRHPWFNVCIKLILWCYVHQTIGVCVYYWFFVVATGCKEQQAHSNPYYFSYFFHFNWLFSAAWFNITILYGANQRNCINWRL